MYAGATIFVAKLRPRGATRCDSKAETWSGYKIKAEHRVRRWYPPDFPMHSTDSTISIISSWHSTLFWMFLAELFKFPAGWMGVRYHSWSYN